MSEIIVSFLTALVTAIITSIVTHREIKQRAKLELRSSSHLAEEVNTSNRYSPISRG
jgi:hypothetical protein